MQLHTALRLALNPAHPDVISVVGGGGKSSTVFRIALDLAKSGRRAIITHTARIAAFQTAWSPTTVESLTILYRGRTLPARSTCTTSAC